jgi:hypothetical protein
MMTPNLMRRMAQARQADLLREAEEYRRAGLTTPDGPDPHHRLDPALPHREPPSPRACRGAVDTRPNITS